MGNKYELHIAASIFFISLLLILRTVTAGILHLALCSLQVIINVVALCRSSWLHTSGSHSGSFRPGGYYAETLEESFSCQLLYFIVLCSKYLC